MNDTTNSLTEEQLRQFITDGHLSLPVGDDSGLHDEIHSQLEHVYRTEGNIGNNILPRVPLIQSVFDQPQVKGALSGLVGRDYIMNPHRHGHLNPPGGKGQSWHKDCYVFDHNIRQPRFQWIMAFYYPQTTDDSMGPSAVIPGCQNLKTLSDTTPEHTTEPSTALCGQAGTITLMNFDAWHRAPPNVSQNNRFMVKFQFARLRQPEAPTSDHVSTTWSASSEEAVPALSHDIWHWLQQENKPANEASAFDEDDLSSQNERARLIAAYGLAATAGGEQILIETMRHETLAALEDTIAKTADNAHGTNPTAGSAARALSSMGARAVPHLLPCLEDNSWWIRATTIDILSHIGPAARDARNHILAAISDGHWWVRRNALEAIRSIGDFSGEIDPEVSVSFSDQDYRVRRNAVLVLCAAGSSREAAVDDLKVMLKDENRYNRFYAALALRRIGTTKSLDIVMDHLFTSRWCPLTSAENRY